MFRRNSAARLVTGCSWDVAARLCNAGETTLRMLHTEWLEVGVFEKLVTIALATHDIEISLELIDGSAHKAPFGGEGTGRNSTDRGKQGWMRALSLASIAVTQPST
jgi:hypothetical protein